MSRPLNDLNIVSSALSPMPCEVWERHPLSDKAAATVARTRAAIQSILDRSDSRLLVIAGPCSIHDPRSAIEYAQRLARLSADTADRVLLVMRVYFEKPRTATGWKGFINDPRLDDSFRIDEGLYLARELLLRINEMGVPAATEALDPIAIQYYSDLIAWTAIGARTTESQTHREMASGLSTPVGFKNGSDGNIDIAVNALRSSAAPHRFLGIDKYGRCAILETRGNRYCHIVLRGGRTANYDAASLAAVRGALKKAGLPENIVVDCSHGNSHKDFRRQAAAFESCLEQRCAGDATLVGIMLESHLEEGRQDIPKDLSQLRYGVSITDPCIGWETTATLIRAAHRRLSGA